MDILKAEHLNKQIKKTKIVSDVSLEVKSGEVVGLLGPNWAGKTTTFQSLIHTPDPTKQVEISNPAIGWKKNKTVNDFKKKKKKTVKNKPKETEKKKQHKHTTKQQNTQSN
ncbi:hypothetical protein JP0566_00010 [Helicobacter pylori]